MVRETKQMMMNICIMTSLDNVNQGTVKAVSFFEDSFFI